MLHAAASALALLLFAGAAGAEGPGKLGYVRLATFNSNTTAAAQEAFYDLQKQGVAGLVLDIRNNGGGLFPAGERLSASLSAGGCLKQAVLFCGMS